jgi:hypothetical protein
VVANWVAEKAFRNYVPNSVKTVERRLYVADMEALIALLKNDLGVSVPDPDS